MPKKPVLLTACALGALSLAACGSSSKVATAPTTLAPTTLAPTTLAPTTAATATTSPTVVGPTTTAPAGSQGTGLFVTGPVPAVTGATDLSKEPIVAAGSAPAPSVLTGQDLVVGTGATALALSDTVKVQYVGALYSTGKVFDASWTDSGPTSFALNMVITGFGDAIVGMKVGGRREIVIPPTFGYGPSGQPPTIPGNATLVFVIDLLGVTT